MNEEAKTRVCDEIIAIMAEHRRQSERGYVDTPGGIENAGDAFKLLGRWARDLSQPE